MYMNSGPPRLILGGGPPGLGGGSPPALIYMCEILGPYIREALLEASRRPPTVDVHGIAVFFGRVGRLEDAIYLIAPRIPPDRKGEPSELVGFWAIDVTGRGGSAGRQPPGI